MVKENEKGEICGNNCLTEDSRCPLSEYGHETVGCPIGAEQEMDKEFERLLREKKYEELVESLRLRGKVK